MPDAENVHHLTVDGYLVVDAIGLDYDFAHAGIACFGQDAARERKACELPRLLKNRQAEFLGGDRTVGRDVADNGGEVGDGFGPNRLLFEL